MVQVMRILLLAVAGSLAIPLGAAEPRAALEVLHGRWTIQGSESTYLETCEWLPGGAFLACRAEDRSEKEPSHSLSVLGYSQRDGHYTYHGFGSSGTPRTLQGFLHDGVWHFHGQSGRAPDWRRWQVTMTPTERGFRFREEASDRSGPWKETAAFDYVRLGPTQN